MTHVWGWASWKRAWNDYDKDLSGYQEADVYQQFLKTLSEPLLAEAWTQIFIDLKAGKIDTWDYQLTITNFFNNGLSIIPNVNLISNIGFGADATHTSSVENINANISLANISHITHPQYILPEKQADFYTLNNDFGISEKKKKNSAFKTRIKHYLKEIKRVLS